ncbi:MAG: mechanosensitive ion channel family protein, partial [Microcystaceae cyanobacterium]
ALVVLLITNSVAKWVRRLVALAVGRTLKSPSLRSLFVQTSYVSAWVVGTLAACIIAFPDLRLGDIIGLLGLGSVAIGFAFQDIFKNFLAGILLLLQEPFQIGDQIQVGEFEGTVEEVAIRSTQLLTYQGERIVIPNAIIFTKEIWVHTALPHRRTDLPIGVDYNTPLPQALRLLQEKATVVEGVLSEPAPIVDLVGFGDSSIDLVVRYWTKPTRAELLRVQTRMIVALKQACDRADINIPYPIRAVYWYNQQKFDGFSPTPKVNADGFKD